MFTNILPIITHHFFPPLPKQIENEALCAEGITMMIHICKYIMETHEKQQQQQQQEEKEEEEKEKEEKVNLDKNMKQFLKYFYSALMIILKRAPPTHYTQITQNFIQSTISLLAEFAIDADADEELIIFGYGILNAHSYYLAYNKHNRNFQNENVLFTYKKGYFPKLLLFMQKQYFIKPDDVLDALKSYITCKTTKPIFTDKEKVALARVTEKSFVALVPRLNTEYVIGVVRDLYNFMPADIEGEPAYKVIDEMVMKACLEHWKNLDKTKGIELLTNVACSLIAKKPIAFKWLTPVIMREWVNKPEIRDNLFTEGKPHTYIHMTTLANTYIH